MFNLNDKVVEIETGIIGKVVDLDFDIEKPYGIIFDDEEGREGVWWCDENMIRKDNK